MLLYQVSPLARIALRQVRTRPAAVQVFGERWLCTWKQVKNSQGRIYYQNVSTGERSWEAPEKADRVLSLEEVEEREDLRVDESDQAKYQGDSIMLRLVNHFWSVVDFARRTYWVAILGAFIWVGYELFMDYW